MSKTTRLRVGYRYFNVEWCDGVIDGGSRFLVEAQAYISLGGFVDSSVIATPRQLLVLVLVLPGLVDCAVT